MYAFSLEVDGEPIQIQEGDSIILATDGDCVFMRFLRRNQVILINNQDRLVLHKNAELASHAFGLLVAALGAQARCKIVDVNLNMHVFNLVSFTKK